MSRSSKPPVDTPASTGAKVMKTTEQESAKPKSRLAAMLRPAGKDSPIYSGGLMTSSVPALPRSTKTSPSDMAGTDLPTDRPVLPAGMSPKDKRQP